MRISSQQMHNTMTSSMQTTTMNVNCTLLQMSSGKEMLQMSDDPRAASQLMGLNDQLAELEQYATNIETARQMSALEESILMDMNDVLMRTRDLAIMAGSDSLTQEDKNAIAEEVEMLTEQLASLANTQSSSGEYIFAGTKSDQPPVVQDENGQWIYQGNDEVRTIKVSDSQEVELGDTAQSILFDPSVFDALTQFSDQLRSGGEVDVDGTIEAIDTALTSVGQALTGVGARINTLDRAEYTNADIQLIADAQRGELEDLDYIEATTRFTYEMTALQASQKSYAMVSQLSLFDYL